jgi:predicted permease
MRRPPPFAAWLLARRVWPDERDVILGDLEEEFRHRSAATGVVRAQLWYWRQSVRLSWSLGPRKLPVSSSHRGLFMTGDDTRYAIRRLLKRPASTMASVLTLAAAIGAAAATWSLLSAVLLNPLPVAEPDRLTVVGVTNPRPGGAAGTPSWTHGYTSYQPIRDSGAFDSLAAGGTWTMMVSTGGYPEPRDVFFASHDYFDALGVRLASGREFTPDDDRREASLTAVLSDRLWRRTFNADPNALGQSITVSGKTAVIIGIAPRRFRGLLLTEAPDLYLPLHGIAQVGVPGVNYFGEPSPPARSSPQSWLTIVGRLPGEGLEQRAIEQLSARVPDPMARGRRPVLQPVTSASLPATARAGMAQFSRLLAITVGFLLLIGCLTVGMLLLVGTEARRDELALCLALGASRLRLARGIALEGGLLTIAGAAFAPIVALALFGGLKQFQLPGRVEIDLLELSIDEQVMIAAVAAAIIATVLVAVVAGAFGFTANVAETLRSRAGATPRLTRRRTRLALVGAQVAMAFVLLAGAGLFARSMASALRLNPGIDTSHLVTGSVALDRHGYSAERAETFFDELRQRLEQHPAVRGAAYDFWAGGMSGGGNTYVNDVARQFPSMVNYTYVDERYFSTVGQPVVRGRDFTSRDAAQAPRVAIVSESFGRLLASHGDPLGLRIAEFGARPGPATPHIEVVGIVPDLITNVSALEPLVLYMPMAQRGPNTSRRLVLRANGDPSVAIREVLTTLKHLDPVITAPALSTIDDQFRRQMGSQRFGAAVMGALGIVATILTLLGTYVLAQSMTVIRKREMGIRAALGATRRQLSASVLRESVVLVGSGLMVGLGLARLGVGMIRSFLFQVQPLDLLTLASVAVMMLVLALVVSLHPAINATRVDLATLLKDA